MSCCVIKATNNHPVGHYSFKIDFTVSNADKNLLEQINKDVMQNNGVITPIKGGYNLSARGKKRVRVVLDFLERYPIISGDLARNRVALLREALVYLETHRGSSEHQVKSKVMDEIRTKLKTVKETGMALEVFSPEIVSKNAVGYFLAGALDGDGSFGFKRSNDRLQPYFAIAMKDQKVIELLRDFLRHGNIRKRKDGVYHYEINHQSVLRDVCKTFLTQYPLQHRGQRERMKHLQRLLNDYTRNP